MLINPGGQAFPQPIRDTSARSSPDPGMTLRDYFAAAALPAVYQARVAQGLDVMQESIAAECWELADAMLIERGRESETER